MKTLLLFFIITASTLLSPSLSVDPDPQTQDLINKICSKFKKADSLFCQQILEDRLTSPKTDLAGLTRITTDAALSSATNGLKFLQTSPERKNPEKLPLYTFCEAKYKGTVLILTAANNSAKRGEFTSMLSLLIKAERPVFECDAVASVERTDPEIIYENSAVSVVIRMGIFEGQMF